jgi:tocopherol O-methyltransferase
VIKPKTIVNPRDVASHYDELDVIYRGVWGEHVHHGLWETGGESSEQAVENLARRVISAARVRSGDHVCDIGCGYGATSRLLAGEYDATVDAITISQTQCDRARALGSTGNRVQYIQGDWMENRFEEETFDAAIAIESSEHMASLSGFLIEGHRVLKPGGRLAVAAWLSAESPARWQVRHLLEPICREGRLVYLGTEREYHDTMAAAGFREIQFEDLSDRVVRTWTLCITRFVCALPCRADYRQILFSRTQLSRVFVKTIFRLRVAYACGAMRYGIFSGMR